MAFLSGQPTFTNIKDLLYPGLWNLASMSGVKEAGLQIDFVNDELDLWVRHKLFSRREIDDESYKRKFADRAKEMLLYKAPIAKDHRVERRKLHARGHQAIKLKPRKA